MLARDFPRGGARCFGLTIPWSFFGDGVPGGAARTREGNTRYRLRQATAASCSAVSYVMSCYVRFVLGVVHRLMTACYCPALTHSLTHSLTHLTSLTHAFVIHSTVIVSF